MKGNEEKWRWLLNFKIFKTLWEQKDYVEGNQYKYTSVCSEWNVALSKLKLLTTLRLQQPEYLATLKITQTVMSYLCKAAHHVTPWGRY